jgi:hypothetical protein
VHRLVIALVLVGCSAAPRPPPRLAYAKIETKPDAKIDAAPSREEVVAYARRYVDLVWVAREDHAFHGVDADGIPVDTPNDGFVKDGWKVGENRGVPYAWGVYDSPEDFARKVEEGRRAGHVPKSRASKRSAETAGIDCSGLLSKSWQLSRTYSTGQLPEITKRLSSFDELLPGDAIDKPNAHVMVFVSFVTADKKRVHVIEGGAWDGRAYRAVESDYDVERLERDGFVPLRDARRE